MRDFDSTKETVLLGVSFDIMRRYYRHGIVPPAKATCTDAETPLGEIATDTSRDCPGSGTANGKPRKAPYVTGSGLVFPLTVIHSTSSYSRVVKGCAVTTFLGSGAGNLSAF